MSVKKKKTGPKPNPRLTINREGLNLIYRRFINSALSKGNEHFGQYLLRNYATHSKVHWPELLRARSNTEAFSLAAKELEPPRVAE